MSKILKLSENGKILKFKNMVIDLEKERADNKRFESDNKYDRIPLYNKSGDTEAESDLFPLPDSNGKQHLFTTKKTQHGTKGFFITNMLEASALAERNWGVIMGLSIRFFPFLRFDDLKVLDKANYKLSIFNTDTKQTIEMPLLDIAQITSVNQTLPAVADTGESGGESLATVIKQKPTELDPSRYMLLKPSQNFEVYIEPENYSQMDNIPHPDGSSPDNFRIYLMVRLHGLFTNVESYY
jgi:hypothetical protein